MPISSSSAAPKPSETDVASLTDMGFTRNQAKRALGETVRIFLFELMRFLFFLYLLLFILLEQ